MATVSLPFARSVTSGRVRPLDVTRDLEAVAGLIELCFAETLDADGRQYISRLRYTARNPGYWNWMMQTNWQDGNSPSGYVWEENGKVIGNLSLIACTQSLFGWGEKTYLIANVAVHPEYRRCGIAKALTQTAMQAVNNHSAVAPWLHVRQENQAALDLYLSLGFKERFRRTTWHSSLQERSHVTHSSSAAIVIEPRRNRHWQKHKIWFNQAYPPAMSWYFPVHLNSIKPGIFNALYGLLSELYLRQWSALQAGELLGCITWQPTNYYADYLWLAVNPQVQERAIDALLGYAQERFSRHRPLALDYPDGLAVDILQRAGFHAHNTLIWMCAA